MSIDPHDQAGFRLSLVKAVAKNIEEMHLCPSCIVRALAEAAMDLIDEIDRDPVLPPEVRRQVSFELRADLHAIVNRRDGAPIVAPEPERVQ